MATAKTRIYVAPDIPISRGAFDLFIQQYSRGERLTKIELCDHLAKQWTQQVRNREKITNWYEATLPTGKSLRQFVPQKKEGVYAIFARNLSDVYPECFYVGISESDIYVRLVQHLHGDIQKDYRRNFNWLKRAAEIVICYGTTQLATQYDQSTKSRLRLLEDCMTVLLRPSFLVRVAR